MSERQFERAMQRMFDDESLTDELTDDEARLLLTWSERQAAHLAQRDMDDAAFDEAAQNLRGLVRRINRLTGRRRIMDSQAQQAALTEIVAAARSLGLAVQDIGITDYSRTQHALDNVESLRLLTESIAPRPTE